MKKSKAGQLLSCKIGKKIASMPYEKFLDGLSYVKTNAVPWSLRMKNLVGKVPKNMYNWIKDKYAEFIGMLSKPGIKEKYF